MRSYAVVKLAGKRSKSMHVELQIRDGVLRIAVLQQTAGVLQTYEIVKLVASELLICWKWKRPEAFAICCEDNGSVEADIWCYVHFSLRNKWLVMLEKHGARVAHVSILRFVHAAGTAEQASVRNAELQAAELQAAELRAAEWASDSTRSSWQELAVAVLYILSWTLMLCVATEERLKIFL